MRFGSSVKMVTSEEAKNKRQILFSTNPNPTAREMLTQQKRPARRRQEARGELCSMTILENLISLILLSQLNLNMIIRFLLCLNSIHSI